MSLVMILCCLWVLAASCIAFMPMRLQFAPGFVLIAIAPVLIAWIGVEHGWTWTVLALLAVLSMFRRPLGALLRRMRATQ